MYLYSGINNYIKTYKNSYIKPDVLFFPEFCKLQRNTNKDLVSYFLSMKSLNDSVNEYKKALEIGDIQIAYKGLMDYILGLKSYFKNKYPEFSVPGSLYQGYMDMTYFPLFPEEFKKLKLKIAIVLVHEPMKIEVWLAGMNKQVQKTYWQKLKSKDLKKYRFPLSLKGQDSIIEYTLQANPDFDDAETLTLKIEAGTLNFIKEIKTLLDE